MKCAPFGLTSVTSSWKPFCLRRIGRTSFSKRLLSSVSLPLLIWNWTLRANCMTFLPEPLSGWSSSDNPKRRAGVDKVPKTAWTFEGIPRYHRSSAKTWYAALYLSCFLERLCALFVTRPHSLTPRLFVPQMNNEDAPPRICRHRPSNLHAPRRRRSPCPIRFSALVAARGVSQRGGA